MTLLIACLLIAHMELPPRWYALAMLLWFIHLIVNARDSK